jgi:hypothetical protein
MRRFTANPYGQLLSAPGTVAFEVAGFVARMAHLMTVLSVVFFVSTGRPHGTSPTSTCSPTASARTCY